MLNIDELKFDEKGLIPAVVVDSVTKKVLTLAYMSKESLAISMEKELTCFFTEWSRESIFSIQQNIIRPIRICAWPWTSGPQQVMTRKH